MTRTALGIVLAVLMLITGVVGYNWYQDRQRTKHDQAEGKVKVFEGEVALLRDSMRLKDASLAAKDSALARANRPRPAGPTRIVYVHTADSSSHDSTAFVPKSDYDLLGLRYDSLSLAVTAYQDAVRPALLAKDRVIASQDSVIKYQRQVINTPKPFRRWSLGVGPGYGATLYKGMVVQGPNVNVHLSYRLF